MPLFFRYPGDEKGCAVLDIQQLLLGQRFSTWTIHAQNRHVSYHDCAQPSEIAAPVAPNRLSFFVILPHVSAPPQHCYHYF